MKTDKGYVIFKNRDSRAADSVLSISNIVKFGYRNRPGCWLCVGRIAYASARGPLRRSFNEWKKYNAVAEEIVSEKTSLEEAVDAFLDRALDIDDSFIGIFADAERAYVLEVVRGNYKVETLKNMALRTNHFLLLKGFNEGFRGLEESKRRLKMADELLRSGGVPETLKTPGILRKTTVATAVVEVEARTKILAEFYAPNYLKIEGEIRRE